MARPLRIEYPGAFYHVLNRGLEKREIFRERKDYEKFLSLCFEVSRKWGVIFHSYCLMPNHYHLMLETPGGQLSRVMRHLDGVYTQFFNWKYGRVGPLFQGRYKAILIEKESYSLELSRYIHLNPVKAGICKSPEQYPFSSYQAFVGEVPHPSFLKIDWILERFLSHEGKAREAFHRFVLEGLDEDWEPFRQAKQGLILGNEGFSKQISRKFLKGKESQEFSRLREIKGIEEEEIQKIVERLCPQPILQRKFLAYAFRRYTPLSLVEIQKRVRAHSYKAVSKMVSRLESQRDQNPQLSQWMDELDRALSNVET